MADQYINQHLDVTQNGPATPNAGIQEIVGATDDATNNDVANNDVATEENNNNLIVEEGYETPDNDDEMDAWSAQETTPPAQRRNDEALVTPRNQMLPMFQMAPPINNRRTFLPATPPELRMQRRAEFRQALSFDSPGSNADVTRELALTRLGRGARSRSRGLQLFLGGFSHVDRVTNRHNNHGNNIAEGVNLLRLFINILERRYKEPACKDERLLGTKSFRRDDEDENNDQGGSAKRRRLSP